VGHVCPSATLVKCPSPAGAFLISDKVTGARDLLLCLSDLIAAVFAVVMKSAINTDRAGGKPYTSVSSLPWFPIRSVRSPGPHADECVSTLAIHTYLSKIA